MATLKKVADPVVSAVCRHEDHNPTSDGPLEPGTWKHECPGCGTTMLITVTPGAKGFVGAPASQRTLNASPLDPLEEFAHAHGAKKEGQDGQDPGLGSGFGFLGAMLDLLGEPEKK